MYFFNFIRQFTDTRSRFPASKGLYSLVSGGLAVFPPAEYQGNDASASREPFVKPSSTLDLAIPLTMGKNTENRGLTAVHLSFR